MAITSKGFAGGPMTDDDFGAIAARGAWVETAAALAVTQPNTGTRTVSIAAGTAVAHGIRAINDAAISQALTAPGSGGQWYLLVFRRDWTSGVKTTTLQVLTGTSTGSTTAPTAVPTAMPATFQTAVGTAQADQALAWVWVSSASTTVTIFDLRLVLVLRALVAATLAALQTLALHSTPPVGLLMPCLDGITYRWTAFGSPAVPQWRPWDSDWATYTPGYDQMPLTSATAKWRYFAGRVIASIAGTVSSTGTAAARFGVPVPGDSSQDPFGQALFRFSDNSLMVVDKVGWNAAALALFALSQVNPPRNVPVVGNYGGIGAGTTAQILVEYDPS